MAFRYEPNSARVAGLVNLLMVIWSRPRSHGIKIGAGASLANVLLPTPGGPYRTPKNGRRRRCLVISEKTLAFFGLAASWAARSANGLTSGAGSRVVV